MTNSITNTTQLKKIIITCFLAGCLEIYDFTIFGFLTAALHKNYFAFLNEDSKDLALLASYALFGVGFIFRPLGAIIFGHIGDRYGRKKALVTSITMMGTASLGMCLLPTYQTIGISACFILVFLRIIQGLSVGGEYSGAIIFAVEHAEGKRAGLLTCLVVSGCMSGVLLATLVSNILKSHDMPEYSWRFAFLLGFVLSILGFFIRKKLHETPQFIEQKQGASKISLFRGIWEARIESLSAIFTAATSGVNLYYISIYMPNYIKHLKGNTAHLASISAFIMAILIPFFGYVSDKIGRARIMMIGGTLLAIYSFILPMIIQNTSSYIVASIAIIIHAMITSTYSGPMNTLIVEIFGVGKRYSCSAFNYSIGMGLIGGTMPMVASLINQYVGVNPLFIGGYISLITSIGLICIFAVSKKQSAI